MNRYYILENDCDTEFAGGPFTSAKKAKDYIKHYLGGLYKSNDSPFCDCLDEDGKDHQWSTSQWIIVQEVERLKVVPKIKIQIELEPQKS